MSENENTTPGVDYQTLDEEAVESENEETPLTFQNVGEFVEGYIAVVYNRKFLPNQRRWCRKWWDHPEALVRLDALWRAWEYLMRIDPNEGLARWLVQYGDPIMRELTHPEGTFAQCDNDLHRVANATENEMLACDPLPQSLNQLVSTTTTENN